MEFLSDDEVESSFPRKLRRRELRGLTTRLEPSAHAGGFNQALPDDTLQKVSRLNSTKACPNGGGGFRPAVNGNPHSVPDFHPVVGVNHTGLLSVEKSPLHASLKDDSHVLRSRAMRASINHKIVNKSS